MRNITARLIEVTCNTLEVDSANVTGATRFTEDLGADSLDSIEVMMAIEDTFGVEFADHEMSELTTIAAVAHRLTHCLVGNPAVFSLTVV